MYKVTMDAPVHYVFILLCLITILTLIFMSFQWTNSSFQSSVRQTSSAENIQLRLTFKPALENKKLVLLLGQMRIGSSFTGELFDQLDDFLYIFEPLESVYTHLYGSQPAWAVPLDLHFHNNKSRR